MTVCIDFTVVIVAYFLSAFCPAVVIASFLALFALLVASVAAVDIASCFALFALEVASAEAVLIAEVFASFAFLVASLAAVLIISCLIVVISVEETLLLISPSSTLNCAVTSFLYSVKAFSASSGAGDQSVSFVLNSALGKAIHTVPALFSQKTISFQVVCGFNFTTYLFQDVVNVTVRVDTEPLPFLNDNTMPLELALP